MDASVWSTRNGEAIHPLSGFSADRFLLFTNFAGSGPSRQNSLDKNKPESLRCKPRGGEPTFSLETLRGAFIPFGGGDYICSGRHFAKHVTMLSFALLCIMYGIELRKGTTKPEAIMAVQRYLPKDKFHSGSNGGNLVRRLDEERRTLMAARYVRPHQLMLI